jgi:3-oxoacyl-[acyl-carrier protein] reductase
MVKTYYQQMGEEGHKMRESDINFHPMKRFALPEDIGNLCVFLASDKASLITGTEIIIDGGLLAKWGRA